MLHGAGLDHNEVLCNYKQLAHDLLKNVNCIATGLTLLTLDFPFLNNGEGESKFQTIQKREKLKKNCGGY